MRFRGAIVCLVAGAHAVSCVDFSPVRFVAPDAGVEPGDAGDDDGGTTDGGAKYSPEMCQTCIENMCPMPLEACNVDPKCKAFAACMTRTQCWNEPIADFSSPPPCLPVCGMEAQITGQTDPAVGLLIGLFVCTTGPTQCAPTCARMFVD